MVAPQDPVDAGGLVPADRSAAVAGDHHVAARARPALFLGHPALKLADLAGNVGAGAAGPAAGPRVGPERPRVGGTGPGADP
jgi:hypothetical protein